MTSSHELVRNARTAAGMTQAALAERLGTTQSAVARMEAYGANPRVDTLRRALAACGRHLSLDSGPARSSIDETLVARQLRLTPAQRLASFETAYTDVRKLALAGRRARGELA